MQDKTQTQAEAAPQQTSSMQPHPKCTPEQLAAIEKHKREMGIDPTALVNLVMKMRENPAIEQALLKAAKKAAKESGE